MKYTPDGYVLYDILLTSMNQEMTSSQTGCRRAWTTVQTFSCYIIYLRCYNNCKGYTTVRPTRGLFVAMLCQRCVSVYIMVIIRYFCVDYLN